MWLSECIANSFSSHYLPHSRMFFQRFVAREEIGGKEQKHPEDSDRTCNTSVPGQHGHFLTGQVYLASAEWA